MKITFKPKPRTLETWLFPEIPPAGNIWSPHGYNFINLSPQLYWYNVFTGGDPTVLFQMLRQTTANEYPITGFGIYIQKYETPGGSVTKPLNINLYTNNMYELLEAIVLPPDLIPANTPGWLNISGIYHENSYCEIVLTSENPTSPSYPADWLWAHSDGNAYEYLGIGDGYYNQTLWWYNITKHDDPSVYSDFLFHTLRPGDCTQLLEQPPCGYVGCHWYNGTCHLSPPSSCELLNNQSDCENYGCYWYDNSCHTNPPPTQDFWTFSTVGQSDLPEYTEGWCAPPNQRCFYPLPDCTYIKVEGEIQTQYPGQHGVTIMMYDYLLEEWINLGSVQVWPGDWYPFSLPISYMSTASQLLLYTTLETTIDIRNGKLYYSECATPDIPIAVIDETHPEHGYHPGPATPGTLFGLGNPYIAVKNIGTIAGYLYLRGYQYPGQPNEIPGSTAGAIVQPGMTWLYNPVISVDPDATDPHPVGVKAWSEGETEPPWGSMQTKIFKTQTGL